LDQLTQILAKVGISSSLEEEILTAAESLITPPEANDETTYKELCTSDDEQSCEQEIEEDNEELRHDLRSENYAYESIIERWFQAGTRLDPFSFYFCFVKLQSQQLISHSYIYFRWSIAKFTVNIFLLLLRLWLHWKFDYT
jgi:hypothetical protein